MEQFEQLLTCAICLDRYKNPKLLPCQHSFCMEPCMDGLVDYVRRQVKCPECRAEHRIPYQGVQGFPTNVTLQRFLELHIEITGELPDPTSGLTMERCSVCSEKNYLNLCVHCDKKICQDCKGAHMDILRREIIRINNQVRRALHRLHDALSLVEKHTTSLRTNCNSISEEVDEIYRRLAKALKDRATFLSAEIDRYSGVEQRNLVTLKENLQLEINNIESNCDLADKHMIETVEWDDAELMDAKEIFLRTVEFIRNFEYENMDYTRRVRFSMTQDPNQLVLHVANFGDLTINMPHQPSFGGSGGGGNLTTSSSTGGLLQPPGLNAGPGLMRSKSEHRLAAQMRHQDPDSSRSGYRYGETEDQNSGRISPLGGRKFGERPRNNYDRYGATRTQDYPELESPYDEPGSGTRRSSRFRSRFRHDNPDSDPDTQPTGRSVRFSGTDQPPQKERERVFDTEDATRGPLSGIFRLYDSPRVMKRLQESQRQRDKPKEKPKETPAPAPTPTPTPQVQVQPKTPVATRGAAQRQVSEEDEIARIKKLNKAGAAACDAAAVAATGKEKPTPPPPQPTAQESSEAESEDDVASLQQQQQRGKTTSRRSSTASDSAGGGATSAATPAAKTTRSASSDSSSSAESSAVVGKGREKEASKLMVDGLKKTLLTPTTNTPVSSTAARNTGAAFSTDEVKQKFLNRGDSTTTTRPETKDPPRFQSRFLGAGRGATTTPAPQEKKEETEESSSDSDSSESSSEEEDAPPPTTTVSTGEKTDIGALLARSQNARDTSEARRRTSMDETPATRPTVTSRLTASSRTSSREEPEPPPTTRPYTSRFLNRSRSSAALSPEEEEAPRSRYGTASSTAVPSTTSSTEEPRYGSSRSRYAALKERRSKLARSKSSHNFGDDDEGEDGPPSPTSVGIPASYLPSRYGAGELSRSRSTHALKSRENSPERSSTTYGSGSTNTSHAAGATGEKDGAALSSWARYLKNKYGTRGSGSGSGASGTGKDASGTATTSSNTASRRLSLGLPLRHTTGSIESSDDDQKNLQGSPTTLTAATAGIAAAGMCPRAQYLAKRRQLFKIGGRGSEPGCFTWPRGLAVGPDNSIVVADSSNHRVQVFDSEGVFLKEFGSYGNSEGEFDCLAGVAVNRIGQFIIADRYNHRIQVLDPSGRFLRAFGSQGTADGRFNYPWGITTDALGFVYVCDKENHRVQVFQSDGTFVGKFGSCGSKPGQLEHPHYIAVSSTNRVIVSDSNNHRIQIFDVNGRVLTTFGTEGSEDGQFKFPRGVAVDEQGYICVADSGNNRIQIFHPDGTFLRAFGCWGAGDGEFKGLEGVAVMSNGNILVCDRENHRVQVF